MSHGQHSEASQFLRRVEDDRRKSGGHFGIESDLDTSLDLVLAFDEQIEKLLRVDDRLSEVSHQPDQRRVPLVHDLRRDM